MHLWAPQYALPYAVAHQVPTPAEEQHQQQRPAAAPGHPPPQQQPAPDPKRPRRHAVLPGLLQRQQLWLQQLQLHYVAQGGLSTSLPSLPLQPPPRQLHTHQGQHQQERQQGEAIVGGGQQQASKPAASQGPPPAQQQLQGSEPPTAAAAAAAAAVDAPQPPPPAAAAAVSKGVLTGAATTKAAAAAARSDTLTASPAAAATAATLAAAALQVRYDTPCSWTRAPWPAPQQLALLNQQARALLDPVLPVTLAITQPSPGRLVTAGREAEGGWGVGGGQVWAEEGRGLQRPSAGAGTTGPLQYAAAPAAPAAAAPAPALPATAAGVVTGMEAPAADAGAGAAAAGGVPRPPTCAALSLPGVQVVVGHQVGDGVAHVAAWPWVLAPLQSMLRALTLSQADPNPLP
jgi:hypothetical protein